jgi:hypothetical protein
MRSKRQQSSTIACAPSGKKVLIPSSHNYRLQTGTRLATQFVPRPAGKKGLRLETPGAGINFKYPHWYARILRKVLIDNHIGDWLPGYEHYDPDRIAETILSPTMRHR